MDLKNKTVTVIGLGKTGLSSTLFLKTRGVKRVRVSENSASAKVKEAIEILKREGIEFESQAHTRDFITGSDLIVTSPGVKFNSKPILWAKAENIELISEIELAFRFCPCPIVAVSGTNGKSTVTTLIGKILAESGRDAVVCGNIGTPFIEKVPEVTKDSLVVLETSSFQLQFIKYFKPFIGVLLNISQNHLDWHPDMVHYINAKSNLFKNQGKEDFAILNSDDKNLQPLKNRINADIYYFSRKNPVKGAFIKEGKFYVALDGIEKELFDISEVKLPGAHNLENILASILVSSICNTDSSSIRKGVTDFKGLEHRFEFVDLVDGVKYIDDSKSTTVDATLKAISSLDERVVLIAGGRDKGSNFFLLRGHMDDKMKHLVLIGEAREKIAKALNGLVPISLASSLKEAVLIARQKARAGECVLLSPMCTSFDMFKNFEERGECFKEIVFEIKNSG